MANPKQILTVTKFLTDLAIALPKKILLVCVRTLGESCQPLSISTVENLEHAKLIVTRAPPSSTLAGENKIGEIDCLNLLGCYPSLNL